MNIIKVEDKFEINNRGTVFIFYCPDWLLIYNNKNNLLDKIFKFNYQNNVIEAKIIGVERFKPSEPLLLNKPISVLIKKI